MSLLWLITSLLLGILLIISLITRFKINAFFALLLAAIYVGVLAGLPLEKIPDLLKDGFGETMKKIGLVIILGTALGLVLEKTGATLTIANWILSKIKQEKASAAISITGFLVGLPIFCDSGFLILSGLNHSLTKRTGLPMALMATSLAVGLYGVHCLVPPHPGIAAAVGSTGADLGQVMLLGILLAIPASAVGYFVAKQLTAQNQEGTEERHQVISNQLSVTSIQAPVSSRQVTKNKEPIANSQQPIIQALIPVLLPIFLIGLKSILFLVIVKDSPEWWVKIVSFLGDPIIALLVSLIVAIILLVPDFSPEKRKWLSEGVDKAGMILAIVAGGGVFGAILKATHIGDLLGDALKDYNLGIWLPFLITVVLKTAQGSSTVAVLTAASLIVPLFPQLGLDSTNGKLLATLAMGAGSMMISHTNDAFFWVISEFSGLETRTMLRVYSVATIAMSVVTQLLIWVLAVFML